MALFSSRNIIPAIFAMGAAYLLTRAFMDRYVESEGDDPSVDGDADESQGSLFALVDESRARVTEQPHPPTGETIGALAEIAHVQANP